MADAADGSPRHGQAPPKLTREEFAARFRQSFYDPAFDAEAQAISRLEAIAWDAYLAGRKSPRTRPAGPGFADPAYELSVEWTAAREALQQAQSRQRDPASPSRVLVVCASPRNDGTCPGEMSKTFRLAQLCRETLEAAHVEPDLLDLSRLTSEPGRRIFPCKGCVSTAMPLCHWPCSCYPNHSLQQVGDVMNDVYARWTAAHGVILVTPVHWYQATSPLKLMMDRLVCADGGNPDPTLTGGKDAARAKEVERAGWSYPKHLEGRVYGLVVHGDVAGIEGVRRALSDWLDWMGLVDAGPLARLDRFIGYYGPYENSHATLDRDEAVQAETRNVARAVAAAVAESRAGRLSRPDHGLARPRVK